MCKYIAGVKKSGGDLAITMQKSMFGLTEVRMQSSKPSTKEPQSRTAAGKKRDPQSKANKNKKEGEKIKHEYMDVLLDIVDQQVESYNTRFQSNNKEEVEKMLEGLENYPIYSLHRERANKLQQYGVKYARILNILITKRMQLEAKYTGYKEVLGKVQQRNNKMPLEVRRFR